MFCRYSLRTTALDAARTFYADALGLALPEGAAEGSALEAWTLHERARALGAPPHWLGHVAVDDLDRAVHELVALGAEALGPTVNASDGTLYAALRDPGGAVVSLRSPGHAPAQPPVAWHQLHTRDAARSWGVYEALCGWSSVETVDVPDPVGGHRLFAWREGGAVVGSVGNTARWEGVHPHWLFYFPVADVEATAERVRSLGGSAREVVRLRSGGALCACEDPQGAAFGLAERPARRVPPGSVMG
jgi:uncharacterized protein